MVYTGGFSRGCKTCLKRHVKCDEGKPVCNRCVKAKRQCLGYRDESDMLFRDETQTTALKALRLDNGLPYSEQSSEASKSRSGSVTLSPSQSSPGSVADFERQAVDALFAELIIPAQHAEAGFGFLPACSALYHVAPESSPLVAAVHALAFALFAAQRPDRETWEQRSRTKYGEALQKVSYGIKHIQDVDTNELIMAILVFGFIEAATATAELMPKMGLHVAAAERIVRQHAKVMVQDRTGLGVLFGVRTNIATSYAFRNMPLDEFINDDDPNLPSWSDIPADFRANPLFDLSTKFMTIPNLRARAQALAQSPLTFETNRELIQVVDDCRTADYTLISWLAELPSRWLYRTIDDLAMTLGPGTGLPLPPCPFVDKVHEYRDIFVANMFNVFREIRMLIQATIVTCGATQAGLSSEGDLPHELPNIALSQEYSEAVQALCKISNEIIASIPYHLGAAPSQARYEADGTTCASLNTPPAGPLFFFRPMMVAQANIFAPPEQREWLHRVINELGPRFGINIGPVVIRRLDLHGVPLFRSFELFRSLELSTPSDTPASH